MVENISFLNARFACARAPSINDEEERRKNYRTINGKVNAQHDETTRGIKAQMGVDYIGVRREQIRELLARCGLAHCNRDLRADGEWEISVLVSRSTR
jgi:hypothetical protein